MLPAFALASALGLLAAPEALAQNATNLNCNKCVGTGDLAKKAVNKSRLKNNAVTGAKIKNGSVGLGDLSPAVQQLITGLQNKVSALEARLDTAESDIAALQQGAPTFAFLDFVTHLAAFVVIDEVPTDLDGDGTIDMASELLPRVLFEGVNVQVVNGDISETIDTLNGLGNLIVGYNEPRTLGDPVCSDGDLPSQGSCEPNNVWALDHKSGSHNLVAGLGNAYSQTGGILNIASGRWSSISGGSVNLADGERSSVSGGASNTARRIAASVSGGVFNTAIGIGASVSGGEVNTASGENSSVSGGGGNTAFGNEASVSGGRGNTASGESSSVSGGFANLALGGSSSVSGGFLNAADANDSSVSGGQSIVVDIPFGWAGGTLTSP